MRTNRRNTYRVSDDGQIFITPRSGFLRRLPATESRVRALEDVQQKLAQNAELLEYHSDHGRAAVFRSIVAVVEYFASLGIPNATLAPLSVVAGAIADAEEGISSPIFTPKSRAGGNKKGQDRLAFEGVLAVVTECCVRHCKAQGMRPYLEPGAKMAADLVNRSPMGIKVTATEMREIRERVSNDPRGATRRKLHDTLIAGDLPVQSPLTYAQFLVRHDWVSPA